MSGRNIEAERPVAVVFEVPRLISEGTGTLAVKKSLKIDQQSPAHEPKTPEECAQGKVEHLRAVIEGREEHFCAYFVLNVDPHDAMHSAFLKALQLPECSQAELTENPGAQVVFTENGINLIRSSNVYSDGVAFDVLYQTSPAE